MHTHDVTHMCKGWETGVPSVPSAEVAEQPPEAAGEGGGEQPSAGQGKERLPYLTPGGTLGIPFDAPERYFWWKVDGERMSVKEIMAETQARVAATMGKEDHAAGI